jgi:hypothetical protein
MIINFEKQKNYFCGFDNYVRFYREDTHKNYPKENNYWLRRIKKLILNAVFVKDSGIAKVMSFKMPNQEIYLAWIIFFMLSTLCFLLVILSIKIKTIAIVTKIILSLVSIFIFLSSFVYTLYVVRELVDKNSRSQSYRENQCKRLLEEIKQYQEIQESQKDKNRTKESVDSPNLGLSYIAISIAILLIFGLFVYLSYELNLWVFLKKSHIND